MFNFCFSNVSGPEHERKNTDLIASWQSVHLHHLILCIQN